MECSIWSTFYGCCSRVYFICLVKKQLITIHFSLKHSKILEKKTGRRNSWRDKQENQQQWQRYEVQSKQNLYKMK